MEQRTYYTLMVGVSLVLILAGIVLAIISPLAMENVTAGMFMVAIGVLILLALVHYPPPHHIRHSFKPKR